MIGDNSSNMKQKGQVLLIIVMLAAVATTVVLSLAFTSRTETQLTKLEEENQKALAAAEAGVEAALKGGPVADLRTLPGLGEFTGQVSIQTTGSDEFVSPLVAKDSQFTFYLSDYDTEANSFSNPYSGNVTVYYGSSAQCDDSALEFTTISGSSAPYTVTRSVADTGGRLGSDVLGVSTLAQNQQVPGGLTCSPPSQTSRVQGTVEFSGSGGNFMHYWSISTRGADCDTTWQGWHRIPSTFRTSCNSPGNYTVELRDWGDNQTATCQLIITGAGVPAPTSTPMPTNTPTPTTQPPTSTPTPTPGSGGSGGGDQIGIVGGGTISGSSFACKTQPIAVPADARVMIVRTLFEQTKLGFVGNGLRPQGRYIISEAQSATGVTKKVQFFQSHPQVPSDFFITSF